MLPAIRPVIVIGRLLVVLGLVVQLLQPLTALARPMDPASPAGSPTPGVTPTASSRGTPKGATPTPSVRSAALTTTPTPTTRAAKGGLGPIGMPRPDLRPHNAPIANPALQTPTVLRSFTAPEPNADVHGRAIGFDGTNFWITYRGYLDQNSVEQPNPYIYEVSTSGQLLQTFNVGKNIGALAWDPTRQVFWAGGYENSADDIYTFNPATGTVTLAFTFTPQGGNCAQQPVGLFDGLAYDPSTDSLWISDDEGNVVFNLSTTGVIRSYFPFSKAGYNCQSGIAVQTYTSGSPTLWLVDVDDDVIVPTDLNGNPLQGFLGNLANIEGIVFDNVTFPGQCAIWENNAQASPAIAAYQVPCTAQTPVPVAPQIEPAPTATNQNPPNLSSGYSGGGVNTSTGSYTYTYTDLAIPGRGPAIDFARTYNSDDTRLGAFSGGWTHSYNIRLRLPGPLATSGTIAVVPSIYLVGPLGRSDLYTRNADGSYTPPPGVTTKLTQNADGTWTATLGDQTTWSFDSIGNLTAITDRDGNRAPLTYNTYGQLASVGDPAGRGSLTLSYLLDGQLGSVH